MDSQKVNFVCENAVIHTDLEFYTFNSIVFDPFGNLFALVLFNPDLVLKADKFIGLQNIKFSFSNSFVNIEVATPILFSQIINCLISKKISFSAGTL